MSLLPTRIVPVQDTDFDWMISGEPVNHRGFVLPPGGVDAPFVLNLVRSFFASWLIVSEREVVGLCSYIRPPRSGVVEIGYGIAQSRRHRGHATRAIADLLRLAQDDSAIRAVYAETSLGNPLSARVLENNGFKCTGERVDPEDGEVATWEKRVAPSTNLKTKF